MIDKLNNINSGSTQNKRISDNSKDKVSSSTKNVSEVNTTDKKNANVDISSELSLKTMRAEAPIDTAKVSAIKSAISNGDYPIDIDKVADALLQAYQDIK
jgi:negative regulator of flagellin synthesis FlgM